MSRGRSRLGREQEMGISATGRGKDDHKGDDVLVDIGHEDTSACPWNFGCKHSRNGTLCSMDSGDMSKDKPFIPIRQESEWLGLCERYQILSTVFFVLTEI